MAKVRATFKISDNTVLCRSYTDEVDWSDVPDHHNACSAVFIKNGRCTSWETTFFNTGEISPTCQTLYIPSFTASLAANVKTPGSYTVFKNDPDIELVSLVSSDIDWTNIYPMFTSCEVQLKEDPESSGILLLSTTFFEDSAEGGWSLDVGSFNASVKKVLTSPGTYTLKRVTQP
jgi:hypothetical protein